MKVFTRDGKIVRVSDLPKEIQEWARTAREGDSYRGVVCTRDNRFVGRGEDLEVVDGNGDSV